VINFDFTARYLFNFFTRIVYYCNDDHTGLSKKINPGWIARYHEKSESYLAKRAELCVGTSSYLTAKLSALNANSVEIRLGAPDVPDSIKTRSSKARRPGLIHVGVVGFMNTIDLNIINSLISMENIAITIVGPYQKSDTKRITSSDRLNLTGPLTGNSLYNEIAGFDVGLIPYNLKGAIDRTPNKLWQYLAMGIPVVITNIKGIKNWEFPDDFVYRANDIQEFYDLIQKAVKRDNEKLKKSRIAFAAENSWDSRVDHLIAHFLAK
jgi:glycosyltransferase involved in cell wall biosynthesis